MLLFKTAGAYCYFLHLSDQKPYYTPFLYLDQCSFPKEDDVDIEFEFLTQLQSS